MSDNETSNAYKKLLEKEKKKKEEDALTAAIFGIVTLVVSVLITGTIAEFPFISLGLISAGFIGGLVLKIPLLFYIS